MPKTGSTKHRKTAADLSLCAKKKSKILEHSHINRFFVANFAICSKFSAETFSQDIEEQAQHCNQADKAIGFPPTSGRKAMFSLPGAG
jgi:hypothetical protein